MTPVVLAHGFLGHPAWGVGPLRLKYFHRIDRGIIERGHPLILPRVSPTGGIATRARELKQDILRELGDMTRRGRTPADGRCVILAHSMGGLDARYMLSQLGMKDRVRALVTIATPHRGSPFADWAIRNIDRGLGLTTQLARFGLDLMACHDLTGQSCRRFNECVPDARGVAYFSVSAARAPEATSPLLRFSQRIITETEGDNDGLVSVASARWGEHLATWPADHLLTINRRLLLKPTDDRTGDITPRYLEILDELEARGLVEG